MKSFRGRRDSVRSRPKREFSVLTLCASRREFFEVQGADRRLVPASRRGAFLTELRALFILMLTRGAFHLRTQPRSEAMLARLLCGHSATSFIDAICCPHSARRLEQRHQGNSLRKVSDMEARSLVESPFIEPPRACELIMDQHRRTRLLAIATVRATRRWPTRHSSEITSAKYVIQS